MKKILFSISLILFFLSTLCSPNSFAQDAALLGLPEDTKVRLLGKTQITSDIVHLSDGLRLAVPTRMGIWVYDVQTGEALDLIRVPIEGGRISFSPNGQTFATARGDYTVRDTTWTIRLWDARTSERLHTLMEDNPSNPNTLLFSPNGQIFATVSSKAVNHFVRNGISYADFIYTLRLWDVHTGKLLRTLVEDKDSILDISFSPDGRTLTVSRGGLLQLWDVHTGELLDSKTGTREKPYPTIRSLGSNGQMGAEVEELVRGVVAIRLWDLSRLWEGPETRPIYNFALIGHTHRFIDDILFSSDGQTVASSSRDGTIILWNTRTGKNFRFRGYNRPWTDSISLSPDGQSLAHSSESSKTLRLWDATGKHLHTIREHVNWSSPSFSPDGQTLVAFSSNEIGLWDAHTRDFLRADMLGTVPEYSRRSLLSPDGQTVATASAYEYSDVLDLIYTLRLWDTRSGNTLHTLRRGDVEGFRSMSFSPDGQILAASYWDGTIRLWDVRTGRYLHSFAGYASSSNNIPFSPDGQTLATIDGGKKKIHLLDVHTGKRLRTLTGHTDEVVDVVYAPNGDTIASRSWDMTTRLWDTRTGKRLHTLTRYFSVWFSPDGQTFLTHYGNSPDAELWDVKTGKRLELFKGRRVSNVFSFSPDGQTLLGAGTSGNIDLWNVSTGAHLHTLTGVGDNVDSLLFSPDGQTLVTGSDVSATLLWDLSSLLPQEPVVQIGASQRPPMYWIDTQAGTLHRLLNDKVENLLPRVQNATHLAVDVATGKLYWTEKTGKASGRIQSADLNGSNIQLVKKLTSVPLDLALDPVNKQLYLTNSWGKVQRLNVDGSGFQPNLITGLESPEHLALDLERGKIYWTEKTDAQSGSVHRANLDGTNIELVKALKDVPQSIAVDSGKRKIYLTIATGKIQRMNLNGSGFQRNFIKGLETLGEIAVDVIESKLYWVQGDQLRRADLKGDNIQDVVTRLGAPANLALGIVQVQDALAAAPILTGVPDQTLLLTNYPNPFNPETWIPYHLAEPGDVSLAIYGVDGRLVRRLALGHQPPGIYTSQSRAVYWNGRNAVGEPVASGVYFYTFTAGEFTATRKMVIRK